MKDIEDVSCPLGCAPSDQVRLVGRDLLHDVPGDFTVVQCESCGLSRTNPRPTPEAMSGYYPESYGPYLGTRVEADFVKERGLLRRLLSPLVRNFWVPLHSAVFRFNYTNTPAIPVGRMLEIGCASGSYLKKMSENGWDVQGVEFSPSAAEASRALGFDVFVGRLEQAPLPSNVMDLIVGWMVLEHLHDPIACLQKLRTSAKPDAWLAISVPNAASLEYLIFGRRWYALQVPTHLYHFTPKTLGQLLDKGGWELKKVHHQRSLGNLAASVGYWLRDKGFEGLGGRFIDFPERHGFGTYAIYPLAWLFSLFGQTGRMTVWAQPKLQDKQ